MSNKTLGLLVAGGQSTRMGTDKAFLPYPLAPTSPTSSPSSTCPNATKEGVEEHTESLWIHLLRILLRVCPEGVVVSHNARQRGRMETDLRGFLEDSESSSSSSSSSPSNSTSISTSTSSSTSPSKQPQLRTPYIELLPDSPDYTTLGPAAALLTAHKAHPSSTFLVVAVDFPYITQQTLSYLLEHHNHLLDHHQEPPPSKVTTENHKQPSPSPSPVTTYFHPSDMHPEPLLSVWGPEGLRRLRRNAIEGVIEAGLQDDDAQGREGSGGMGREVVINRRRRTGPCYTAKELWREIISSEAEAECKGEADIDPEPALDARSPFKAETSEHGQNKSKDKSKPKDELPPAIVARFGVLPKTEGELRNTNTREEWDAAVEELKAGYCHNGEAGRG